MSSDHAHEPHLSTKAATLPAKAQPKLLPPFRVLLHNDDHNTIEYVVETILHLTHLTADDAVTKTFEAHTSGVALLLVTHRERAELYVEQFQSAKLVASMEPDE